MLCFRKYVFLCAAVALAAIAADGASSHAARPGGGPTPAQLNPAIAFVAAQPTGREDIVVAAADLASEIVLTKSLKPRKAGRLEMGSPAWSPDGKSVAFWVRDWVSPYDAPTRLYVARADGSGLAVIRDFSTRPDVFRPAFPSDGLNWSPTGKELVYSQATSDSALVAIDAVSGDVRVLLYPVFNQLPIAHPALSPILNPTASGYQGMLAVTGPDGTGYGDVFTVPIQYDANGYLRPIDPDLFVNVTNAPASSQFHPSWSPDGTELAIFDNGELAVIDLASGALRTLPGGFFTHVNADERATWTADGQYLVYKSPAIGTTDLAIMAADGGGVPQRYTLTPNRLEYAPAWNPQWDPAGPGGF